MFIRVYHLTHCCNRPSIRRQGLKPIGHKDPECRWKSFNYSPRIYLSTRRDDVYSFDYVGYEHIDLWTFVVLKCHLRKDTISSSNFHYYTCKHIPPEQLRIIETIV